MTDTTPVNWAASLVRITLFSESLPTRGDGWWLAVAGEEPATRQDFPREGKWIEAGPCPSLPGALLQVQLQAGRVDWVIGIGAPEDGEIGGTADLPPITPIVGPMHEITDLLSSLIRGWVRDSAPPTTRMAAGGILLAPVETRAAGYRMLSDLLPFEVDPESSDFSYQINRRRELKAVPGARINRLSKWSVARFGRTTMTVAGGAPVLSAAEEPELATRVEIDVNTVAGELGAASGELLLAIQDELVQAVFEIAEKGDIP